jgi:dTDP-4-amino-4,6-dideoxygalactose transaminase
MMKVPFLDLKAQYISMKEEIHAAIQQVLDKTAFAGGPFVAQFEKEFTAFCDCKEGIGVGSGTEALWLCLLALGIGPGDEVITVPNSFVATAEAISFCGATPVFVDVDPRTYTLDPNKLEDYLKKRSQESETGNQQPATSNVFSARVPRSAFRIRAVIPVHLFGQPADMDPILDIARKYNLGVIEDACQAHGAEYKREKAGSLGDAGCFSFYPGKNLGAYGEAGAVVTHNSELAGKMRMLRDHGQSKKYHHDVIGWNNRMDGIQGAILSAKLKHLSAWNESRRRNSQLYSELLKGADSIIVPEEAAYARHIYHVYALRVQNRDKVMNSLGERGISCGIHYPVPIHLTDAYKFLGLGRGSFPVAEQCADEFLSLPMFPELTPEQVEYVATEIKRLI